MSDYGVNFGNGSTGGEYSHTLSQQEMPSFNISGKTSTNGEHYHDSGWGESYGGRYGYYGNEKNKEGTRANTDWNNYAYRTSTDGEHSHTFNISFNSKNYPFKTISPYLVVYMWKRKA